MAKSTFSSFTDRANEALSNMRGKSGTAGGSRQGGGYDAYRGREGYRYSHEYRSDVGDPYDDIDDVSGVGEVRVRDARRSSGGRYHPPLLSFDEARTNTYVPDRMVRDPMERYHAGRRRFEHPATRYTPRVRDSVNVGKSSEYDYATAGTVQDKPAVPKPAGSSAGTQGRAPAASPAAAAPAGASSARVSPLGVLPGGPAERAMRSGTVTARPTGRKLRLVAPKAYDDARQVTRILKAGDVAVLSLVQTPPDLAKRILDFSFGAANALDAGVECVADRVFIISRGQGLSKNERALLQAQGFIK